MRRRVAQVAEHDQAPSPVHLQAHSAVAVAGRPKVDSSRGAGHRLVPGALLIDHDLASLRVRQVPCEKQLGHSENAFDL